jgi:hypothetical protein
VRKFGPDGGVTGVDRERDLADGRRGGRWDISNWLSDEEATGVVIILCGFVWMLIGMG